MTLNREVVLSNFPNRHFRLTHNLESHPLFELDRLLRLARHLPPSCIECYSGTAAISQDPSRTPTTGLSVERTLQTIEVANGWVALKYVEIDPDYRELLVACVNEILPYSELCQGGTHQLEGYVFVSSPGSVTPFHFDDEHNFLLQLCGWKHVHTWASDSPGAVTHVDLERTYVGGHRNVPLRPEIRPYEQIYKLEPGQGLHIPVHSPHWVKNGDQISISFSVTFRTKVLTREATVHWANGKLRSRGFSPTPFGVTPLLDGVKYWAVRVLRFAMNRLRRA